MVLLFSSMNLQLKKLELVQRLFRNQKFIFRASKLYLAGAFYSIVNLKLNINSLIMKLQLKYDVSLDG
jgi:hypothetical protein